MQGTEVYSVYSAVCLYVCVCVFILSIAET